MDIKEGKSPVTRALLNDKSINEQVEDLEETIEKLEVLSEWLEEMNENA